MERERRGDHDAMCAFFPLLEREQSGIQNEALNQRRVETRRRDFAASGFKWLLSTSV